MSDLSPPHPPRLHPSSRDPSRSDLQSVTEDSVDDLLPPTSTSLLTQVSAPPAQPPLHRNSHSTVDASFVAALNHNNTFETRRVESAATPTMPMSNMDFQIRSVSSTSASCLNSPTHATLHSSSNSSENLLLSPSEASPYPPQFFADSALFDSSSSSSSDAPTAVSTSSQFSSTYAGGSMTPSVRNSSGLTSNGFFLRSFSQRASDTRKQERRVQREQQKVTQQRQKELDEVRKTPNEGAAGRETESGAATAEDGEDEEGDTYQFDGNLAGISQQESMPPSEASSFLTRSRSDRAISMMAREDEDSPEPLARKLMKSSSQTNANNMVLRPLSLSTIRQPSAALTRWCQLIRQKVLPSIRHRVVRNQFLSRMTARLAKFGGDSGASIDVWGLASNENGLTQFKKEVDAKVASQSAAERQQTLERIMGSMFRSLQTFHHLMNVQQKTGSDISKGDALRNIMSTLYGLLDCEQVTLFLVDDSGRNFKSAWTQSHHSGVISVEDGETGRLKNARKNTGYSQVQKNMEHMLVKEKGRGIVGLVARTGNTINIEEAEKDPRFNGAIDKLTGMKTNSILCVPVSIWNAGGKFLEQGRIVAVIEALNKRSAPGVTTRTRFSEEDVSLMKFIALMAAQAIESHRLFEENLMRKQQQEALSRMIELMSSETNSSSIMQLIIDTAYRLIHGGVDRINLYIVDEVKQTITCKVSKDTSAIGQKLPLSYGILGTCASKGVSINITDTKTDPRYDRTLDRIHGYTCHNLLTLPILDKRMHVAAIIQCTNKRTGPFTLEDEAMFQSLSRSAGEILRKAQLFEALLVEQRKTRALLAICQADEGSNSVDELSDKILDISLGAVRSELMCICFVDQQSSELMCIAVRLDKQSGSFKLDSARSISGGSNSKFSGGHHSRRLTLKMGTGIPSHVASSGEQLHLTANSIADPHFDPIFDQTFNLNSVSTVCLPMKSATTGATFAVLLAINKLSESESIESFSDEDVEILTAVCAQAGNSVRRRLTEFLLARSRENKDGAVSSMLGMYGTSAQGTNNNKPEVEISEKSDQNEISLNITAASDDSATTLNTPPRRPPVLTASKSHFADMIQSVLKSNREEKKAREAEEATASAAAAASASLESPKAMIKAPTISLSPPDLAPKLTHSASEGVRRHKDLLPSPDPPMFTISAPTTPLGMPRPPSSPPLGPLIHPHTPLAVVFHQHSPALRAIHPSPNTAAGGQHLHAHPPAWGRTHSDVIPRFPPASWSHFPAEIVSEASSKAGSNFTSPRTQKEGGGAGATTGAGAGGHRGSMSTLPMSSPEVQEAIIISPMLRPLASLLQSSDLHSAAGASKLRERRSSSPNVKQAWSDGSSNGASTAAQSNGLPPTRDSPSLVHTRSELTRSQDDRAMQKAVDKGSEVRYLDTSLKPIGTWPKELLFVDQSNRTSAINANTTLTHQPNAFEFHLHCDELSSLNFNCWNYDENELILITYAIFEDSGLIKHFNLNPFIMQNFLLNVRARYRNNPYHNFHHGFGVLQSGYMMLRSTKASTFLNPLEQLALLLSCLCHDIDHPGTTNQFQINCASELAIAHNDQAVLENHHCVCVFSLLRDPALNILDPSHSTLTQADNRLMRRLIILAILSTDMASHFVTCKKLDTMEPSSLSIEKEDDRQFVISLITHTADLSGQVYPLDVAKIWESKVTEEFSQQAALEGQLGLPVAPFMQRLENPAVRFKNHLGFLDFVLAPLYRGIADLYPPLSACVDNLQSNRKWYAAYLETIVAEQTVSTTHSTLPSAAPSTAVTPRASQNQPTSPAAAAGARNLAPPDQ